MAQLQIVLSLHESLHESIDSDGKILAVYDDET